MIAVMKHELSTYFHTMVAYIYCAFMLCFVGVGAMIYNINAAVSNFEYVLQFVCIGLVVIIPVLTMRSISDEKKQKTDQLLYSLPLKTTQIVMGKFFALLIIFMVPIVIIAVYPLIFAQFGEVYLLTSYGSMLAFVLMGAALITIGMFISSLTENQGIAAGIGIPVMLLNYYSVTLSEYISTSALGNYITLCVVLILIGFLIWHLTKNSNMAYMITVILLLATGIVYYLNSDAFIGLVPNIMSQLSLFERFYTFVNGVFDITGVVYFLTVIVFFLFLSVQSLEKRRYN